MRFLEETGTKLDRSTLIQNAMKQFDADWADENKQLEMVPGKEFLSRLNAKLQSNFSTCLTEAMIVENLGPDIVAPELMGILESLDSFCAI